MKTITTAVLLLTLVSVQASIFTGLEKQLSKFFKAGVLAQQVDITDTTTQCYQAAMNTFDEFEKVGNLQYYS